MRTTFAVLSLTLLAATSCGSSPKSQGVDSAFRSEANEVCGQAIAARGEHPFPLSDFDPLQPTAEDVAIVADYFAKYGGGDRTTTALVALGEPADGAPAWKALVTLLRKSDAVAAEQIAAGRARDVPAFVATVEASGALRTKIQTAGEKAGFSDGSDCAKVYT